MSAPLTAPLTDVRITTLPNGLRVASRLMPGLHSASVGVWVGAGGRDERADQSHGQGQVQDA